MAKDVSASRASANGAAAAPPASHRLELGFTTLRLALVSGVALAALVGSAGPTTAQWRGGYSGYYGGGYFAVPEPRVHRPRYTRRGESASGRRANRGEKAEAKKDPGFGEPPKGPQQIVVNIGIQKVTLYANGVRVAQGPVSTGMAGHPTPLGVFSIIEKDRYHHSNIYSGAPMPYMQRITWSGVALHEGVLPGYPASHGCIRMSHDFAMKLWPVTKLGVRVIVTRHDVAPVEFEHAKLFSPKAKPPEQKVAGDTTTGTNVQLAQAGTETTTDAPAPAMKVEQPAVTEPAPRAETVDAPKAAEAPPAKDRSATKETATGTVAPPTAPAAAETLPAPAPDLRKAVDAPAAPAEAAPATPAAAETPAVEDLVKPSPTMDRAKPVVPRTKAADQPTKRTGQVAVFVSRKEKKIFVRQGMVPVFDMPITINEPDQPLGTHVFTALSMTEDGTMHWNLMSIPTDPVATAEDHYGRRRSREAPRPVVNVSTMPASNAAEALDRIQFPKEAVDRISEILTPGSSLVISDAGLGPETGRATEFIVLTR